VLASCLNDFVIFSQPLILVVIFIGYAASLKKNFLGNKMAVPTIQVDRKFETGFMSSLSFYSYGLIQRRCSENEQMSGLLTDNSLICCFLLFCLLKELKTMVATLLL
jgi:hypothetical protein